LIHRRYRRPRLIVPPLDFAADPYPAPLRLVKTVETVKEKLSIDFLKTHTVYKNAQGVRLPGVTTVLGLINKPGLLKWAHECGKNGIEMEAVREKAADIGTIAHALCEAHLRGMELDTSNVSPEMLDRAETAFVKFVTWWDREGLILNCCELAMVSEHMQVGGTLDILATRTDGRLVLVDLKSSKAIYEEMLIQAAVYAAMYEETQGQPVLDVYVVRIGKEDADDVEVREVANRTARVAAFHALAQARRLLQQAGMKL
jgi:hypothetical protein